MATRRPLARLGLTSAVSWPRYERCVRIANRGHRSSGHSCWSGSPNVHNGESVPNTSRHSTTHWPEPNDRVSHAHLSQESAGLVRRRPAGFALDPAVLRLAEAFSQSCATCLTTQCRCSSNSGTSQKRQRPSTFETKWPGSWCAGNCGITPRVAEAYPDLGKRLSLHVGAPSTAILAFMPQTEQEQYASIAADLFPSDPPIDDALFVRLGQVRRQGYAISDGQRSPGVSSVAAPIFDGTGAVVGAINVSGPTERFGRVVQQRLAKLVVTAAATLSAGLGFRESEHSVIRTIAGSCRRRISGPSRYLETAWLRRGSGARHLADDPPYWVRGSGATLVGSLGRDYTTSRQDPPSRTRGMATKRLSRRSKSRRLRECFTPGRLCQTNPRLV